ncbi:hypothetical protein [Nonomuraea africana]
MATRLAADRERGRVGVLRREESAAAPEGMDMETKGEAEDGAT